MLNIVLVVCGHSLQIGRAVALKLALGGYDVACCTRSEERFAALEQELASIQQQQHDSPHDSTARVGTLSMAGSVEEGAPYKLWAVGKYDPAVRQEETASAGTRRVISRVWRSASVLCERVEVYTTLGVGGHKPPVAALWQT